MRFINYLLETHVETLTEKHDLVLQKIIDALDHSHVDYSENKIVFDVGDVSSTPKLKGLKVVIRPGKESSVRLGQGKDGAYAIVVNTTEDLPGRQDIDTFLSSKEIYSGFQKAYTSYVQNVHDHDRDYEQSDTDRSVELNSRDGFEGHYTTLIDAIKTHTAKYEDTVKEIDNELSKVANIGRKKTLELAKENLRADFLGKDANEFVVKVLKLPEAGFTQHLNKEWKEKLTSRLSNYYSQTF